MEVVRLRKVSKRYGRHIGRLDEIPDQELDELARRGFSGLWLIGLWQRSRASQTIKQLRGNPEAVASAYSLDDYRIADDLGGEGSFENLKARAWSRGLRIASDMVPNHMGVDSQWVVEHPDWFMAVPDPPYPSYSFSGPDLSNDGLAKSAADWLEPILHDKTSRSAIGADALSDAVMNLLPWTLRRRLDEEAPTHFTAPTGTAVPIDYAAEQGPTVSIRVQELFGLARHPSIAGGRVPLVVELLSPGHKPVQITRDLPGFWRGSYADVRVEMRGRYPRHPWPDDPANAAPTRRAKPRGT